MSGYPYQTAEHDASISVEANPSDGLVVIEVAAGSCVTIQLPLDPDEAEGLMGAIGRAIAEARQ